MRKSLVGFLLVVGLFQLSQPCDTAQAASVSYDVFLNGPSAAPPNASPGSGFATVTVDDTLSTMQLELTFSGLVGPTTAAHIHAATAAPGTGTAGVATTTPSFLGFPLGVTSGIYSSTLDMTQASSYNPSFVAANGGTTATAFAALQNAAADGKAYLNIHTAVFPGGEIRGFLTPIPEPTTFALLGLGSLAFVMVRQRR